MNQSQPVVLISGASRGIGRETADYLAKRGFRVFAGARDVDRAAVLAETGRRLGLPLEVVQLDVDDPASVRRAVAVVGERAGRIDALVNNAAVGFVGPAEEQSEEAVRRVFETNLFGAMRLTQAILPQMRSQGSGTIIQISSIQGRLVAPFGGLYAASKWALEAYSEALRAEIKPFGIRVVVIEPGFVLTDFAARRGTVAPNPASPYRETLEAIQQRTQRRRERGVPPSEVAAAVQRAITDRRAPFRIPVGPDARLLIPLRKLLPESLLFAVVDLMTARRERALTAAALTPARG